MMNVPDPICIFLLADIAGQGNLNGQTFWTISAGGMCQTW